MNNMKKTAIEQQKAPARRRQTPPTTIVSEDSSLVWNVVDVRYKQEGLQEKVNRAIFTVACSKCGFKVTASKRDVRVRKACPGCTPKPAAVKTDSAGHCISICEIGTIDFIREYQEQHSVSEREAVRQFIDTVKVHLANDDPVAERLTEESVRSSIRRATGKKHDHPKTGANRPNIQDEPRLGALPPKPPGKARHFMMLAIGNLSRITDEAPGIKEALGEVIVWCHERLTELEESK